MFNNFSTRLLTFADQQRINTQLMAHDTDNTTQSAMKIRQKGKQAENNPIYAHSRL